MNQDQLSANSKQKKKNQVEVRLRRLGRGVRDKGLYLTLSGTGTILDLEGHPVRGARLKWMLHSKLHINKNSELIINLVIRQHKNLTIRKLDSALNQIINGLKTGQVTKITVYYKMR